MTEKLKELKHNINAQNAKKPSKLLVILVLIT